MLMLINKKGYSIIEVLCSLMLISLLVPLIFKIQLMTIKKHKYIEVREYKISMLQAVENELYYNCSYSQIVKLVSSNNKYIIEDNLNFNYVYEHNIYEVFVDKLGTNNLGLEINVDMSSVLKITLQIKYEFYGKEESVTCTFSKGDY